MPVTDGAETHCRCKLGTESDFFVLCVMIWLVMRVGDSSLKSAL